jgi:protein phosphatase methylesterase 1
MDAIKQKAEMSDLHKSFAKPHLARLSPQRPPIFDERDEGEAGETGEETSSLHMESPNDSSSSASSTGTIMPSPRKKLFERPRESVACSLSGPH